MIYGIGTDLMKISQIESSVQDEQDPFVLRMYTEKERREILSHDSPFCSYASHFCGKEAVFKCFSCTREEVELSDIEILNHENGVPFVLLHGKAEQYALQENISRIHISMSFDSGYAIAYAMAETTDN